MAEIKWGIAGSIVVENEGEMEKIREFAIWMIEGLRSSIRHLVPSFLKLCLPSEREEVLEIYASIHKEFPDVTYIIHVLPFKNSPEYTWIRNELGTRYALIIQGVLHQNALNKFASASNGPETTAGLPAVFDSMAQWTMRRLSQLVSCWRPENNYKLKVQMESGEEDTNGTADKSAESFEPKKVKSRVSADSTSAKSQYSDEGASNLGAECRVNVSGFPASYTEFQLASLFSDGLQPLFVTFGTSTSEGKREATVTFKNRFHALQTIRLYHQRVIASYGEDAEFTLTVTSSTMALCKQDE